MIFGRSEIASGIFEKAGITKDERIEGIELLCPCDRLTTLIEPADASGKVGISGQDIGIAVAELIAALIRRGRSPRIELSVEQDEA